ncbi:MAG: sugar phosphate isomerase/epimerase family protein [Promethearchaeota archaeon]
MEISVATYSFRHLIKDGWNFEQIADKLIEWQVKFVEINNIYTSPEELPNVGNLFRQKGIEPILLTIDGNNYFQKKEKDRNEQFQWMKKWIDAAENSNISMIRANMGRQKPTKKYKKPLEKIVATFKPILNYCVQKQIIHTFENHGGISADVDFQILFAKQFSEHSEYMGYLLDTGNYRPKLLIYENIKKLNNLIKIVHAKMYNFDENGYETTLDYPKIIELLREIGFDGYLSIEYEGPLQDLEGIEKSVALLKKLL